MSNPDGHILAIDQSLDATAFCVLDESLRKVCLETLRQSKGKTEARAEAVLRRQLRVIDRVRRLVETYQPAVVVFEDYARGAGSNSIIPLAELGGMIKLLTNQMGYQMGLSALWSPGALLIQNQSSMKKFMLGNGGSQKDTAYLLSVYKAHQQEFPDDNQADAWMHGSMAAIVRACMVGKAAVTDLPVHQRRYLLEQAIKATDPATAKSSSRTSKLASQLDDTRAGELWSFYLQTLRKG